MGSKGIRKRKPSRPLPRVGDSPGEGFELRHSPFSFEGMMEGLGRLGRGIGAVSGPFRLVLVAVLTASLVLGAGALLGWLI